jgi:transcriptional regulator with XRE-family HTH domain
VTRLEYERRRKGLTQEQLAHLSGSAFTTINRIERGHTSPTGRTLARLAKALRLPTSAANGLLLQVGGVAGAPAALTHSR